MKIISLMALGAGSALDRAVLRIAQRAPPADVGIYNHTPAALGIGIDPETRFTGSINKITLEVQ